VQGSNLGDDLFVSRPLKLERQLIHAPLDLGARELLRYMNWIGIGAVYPGIEPKVKRSITQTVPIVPVVSVVSNGRKHCDDFCFRNSAISPETMQRAVIHIRALPRFRNSENVEMNGHRAMRLAEWL
jgi:hypothetical protein